MNPVATGLVLLFLAISPTAAAAQDSDPLAGLVVALDTQRDDEILSIVDGLIDRGDAARLVRLEVFLRDAVSRLWDTGRDPLRIALAERAVDVALRLHGAEDPRVFIARVELAHALIWVRNWSAAEQPLRDALGCMSCDPRDRMTWRALLGSVLASDGRPSEAEPHLRADLERWRVDLPPGHIALEPRIRALADVLVAQAAAPDRIDEARSLYQEAGAILLETHGADHVLRITPLVELAAFEERHGDGATAVSLRTEAARVAEAHVADLQSVFGAEDPYQLPTALQRQASVLALLGQTERAVGLHLDAVNLTRTALGDAHPRTRDVAEAALAFARQHRLDSAAFAEVARAFPSLLRRD